MRTTLISAAILALGVAGTTTASVALPAARPDVPAAPRATTLALESVTSGLEAPTDLASPPGSDDLYIIEKVGRIQRLSGGSLSEVGTIGSQVLDNGEQGLLSLAFHPDFADNGRLFLYYTRAGTGDIQLSEVTIENNQIVTGSLSEILRIRHRQADNHNGGDLAFGRGGNLYIATGDGGGSGNQFGHAQSKRSLLGKILRIDVDAGSPYAIPRGNPLSADQGRREIWGIGLRNPWRMSMDGQTGELWIGDVGQNRVEEVDRVAAGNGRLRNFGWSRFEGRRVYDDTAQLNGGRLITPIKTYRHPSGSSVIGGGIYRGDQSPALDGLYLYGDLNGWIAAFDPATPRTVIRGDGPADAGLMTISEAGGEWYAAYSNGTVHRITTPA